MSRRKIRTDKQPDLVYKEPTACRIVRRECGQLMQNQGLAPYPTWEGFGLLWLKNQLNYSEEEEEEASPVTHPHPHKLLVDFDEAEYETASAPTLFPWLSARNWGSRERSWQGLQQEAETSRLFRQDPALGNFSNFCFIGPVGSLQIFFPPWCFTYFLVFGKSGRRRQLAIPLCSYSLSLIRQRPPSNLFPVQIDSLSILLPTTSLNTDPR